MYLMYLVHQVCSVFFAGCALTTSFGDQCSEEFEMSELAEFAKTVQSPTAERITLCFSNKMDPFGPV